MFNAERNWHNLEMCDRRILNKYSRKYKLMDWKYEIKQ